MNYGKVTLTPDGWKVETEAFVRARLKRVFPRAPQHASETITISASAENSRELLWFLQRYPMEVDELPTLQHLAQKHVDAEMRLADLIAGHRPPLEVTLAEPPREYQTFAGHMLQVKEGYLLADDVGLGKTVSAIVGLCIQGNLPALVVVPAHLTRQWRAAINRFAPALFVHILRTGTPYSLKQVRNPQRKKQAGEPSLPDVLITSYHKLRGWAETLAGYIRYVVFDEVQQLRHPGTDIYRAARLVAHKAPRRLGLSATPIYNYGGEFFHVVDVVAPGCLGEHSEFIREYCTPEPGGKAKLSDPLEFGSYLRREGIMLRRTRKDVQRELPELTKVVHEIAADERVLDMLKSNAVELARIVLRHNERTRGEKMQAAGQFDAMMRQATGIAKAPYVVEFVKMLLDSGEPVVLFGWHRAVYAVWMEGLKEFNPVLYTGTESDAQKAETLRAFTAGESQVLIMSLRSGAGVDSLQGCCNTVVFGELDWSPGVHEQCIGRVHRDGQDLPCVAYFLLSESGADPIMSEVLGVKREQIEQVRNPDTALSERIDVGENSLRLLARQFLLKRGVPLPDDETST